MTKLAGFLSFTIILINTFFSTKKKTPILTLILVLIVIEFFLTSYISVIVDNGELWKVSKETKKFILFRVAEVVVFPILMLYYLELLILMNSIKFKVFFTMTWALLLFCIEYLLVLLEIFKYANWKMGWSIATWFIFLILVFLIQIVFNRLLKREGILR